MEYSMFLLPAFMFGLSYKNKVKYHKIKNSGKVPDIMSAGLSKTLFLMLGILTFLICIFFIMANDTGFLRKI